MQPRCPSSTIVRHCQDDGTVLDDVTRSLTSDTQAGLHEECRAQACRVCSPSRRPFDGGPWTEQPGRWGMDQPSDGTAAVAAAAVSPVPGGPGRRPGHSSTREEIARAAREQFAAKGYDRVTLRAVAAQAGVDAALVAYFFGSKRELFDEVVNLPSDSPALMARLIDGDPRNVGERLARLVIEALDETGRRERILATIRTAAVEADTARMIGDKFTTELLEPVVCQLGVAQAPLRAALVMSQILGLTLARHVVGLEDLTSASQDELVAALAPTLQRYLVGDIS